MIRLGFLSPEDRTDMIALARDGSAAHRHNKTYDKCGQFAGAMLDFLRHKVPENWPTFRDTVTDNFRVISPKDFRVMA